MHALLSSSKVLQKNGGHLHCNYVLKTVAKPLAVNYLFSTNVNTYYQSFRKLTIKSSCSTVVSKSPFCWPTQNHEFWGILTSGGKFRSILGCGLCNLNFKLL